MGIFQAWLGGREEDDGMARAKAQPLDAAKIEMHVQRLKLAARDGDAFKLASVALAEDKSLASPELIEIAHRFAGGLRPKTRKAALTAIAQERLRLAHALAKGESAAKARVW